VHYLSAARRTCGECSCLADRVPPGRGGPRAKQYAPPNPDKIVQIKPKSTPAIFTFNYATLKAPSYLFIYLLIYLFERYLSVSRDFSEGPPF